MIINMHPVLADGMLQGLPVRSRMGTWQGAACAHLGCKVDGVLDHLIIHFRYSGSFRLKGWSYRSRLRNRSRMLII